MNKVSVLINNNILKIILISAVSISLISFVYYFQADLITAYGDSRGHLNIARRVVDSQTPGVAQFGGYWMPLLHIFMLPTVWNDFFWQTGISGSIPHMIAYVLAVVYIFKLVFLVSKSRIAATIASIIIMLNPNLIYMQTTPMTESLFIGTLTIFIYYLYKWTISKKETDLILAALFLVLCSINRYEAWLAVFASSLMLLINWAVHKFNKKAEGAFFLFSMLAWIGIFGWLLWGAVIFGDPLEFMHNELSAASQTKEVYSEIKTVGYKNFIEAIFTNVLSIKYTSGYALLFLSIFGLFVYKIKNIKQLFQPKILFIFISLTPLIFDIITVYMGNVPVEVPELSKIGYPGNYFNIRYSLYSLPAIAFFVSTISKKTYIQVMILVVVFLNYFFLLPYGNHKIVVLKDAGVQPSTNEVQQSIKWLASNYDGGSILASTGGSDKHMFDMKIHQKEFITEGTYKIWDKAMQYPTKYAKWILVSKTNKRDNAFRYINKMKLYNDYQIVNKNEEFMILKRKNDN